MLPIICFIAGVLAGAATCICLAAVMHGIDCEEAQGALEEAPGDDSPPKATLCAWPYCTCEWDAIMGHGASCPSRLGRAAGEVPARG